MDGRKAGRQEGRKEVRRRMFHTLFSLRVAGSVVCPFFNLFKSSLTFILWQKNETAQTQTTILVEDAAAADRLRGATTEHVCNSVAHHGVVEDIVEGRGHHNRAYYAVYKYGASAGFMSIDQVKETSCSCTDTLGPKTQQTQTQTAQPAPTILDDWYDFTPKYICEMAKPTCSTPSGGPTPMVSSQLGEKDLTEFDELPQFLMWGFIESDTDLVPLISSTHFVAMTKMRESGS